MPKNTSSRIARLALLLAGVPAAHGAEAPWRRDLERLPAATAAEKQPVQEDWLVKAVERKAQVFRGDRDDEIVLSNGLISRTFRLAPNGATVGFDNLVSGESVIRGVKPEAIVEIDGVPYEVGGLKGQPNYAFLTPEWIEQLEDDPRAFHPVGFEVGKPKERFAWKRARHHAPDAKWPPEGAYLRMDYAMPAVAARQLAGGACLPSDLGRKRLIRDEFETLSDEWDVHVSESHVRSSFVNEGKVGEIYTPQNTAVFAERALPPGVRLVEVTIDAGTDKSRSWGPGIALVWPDRTIQFHLRPGGNRYDVGRPMLGVFDGEKENPRAGGRLKLDLSMPWTLRLRVEEDAVHCEAKPQGGAWKTYETIRLDEPLGDPQAARIGKMRPTEPASPDGGGEDDAEAGDLVRLRVLRFAAYSGLDDGALATLSEELKEKQKVRVSVHYELYDGVPILSKWITVHNGADRTIIVNRFVSEILAAVESESRVEERGIPVLPPKIHVETDYSMGGLSRTNALRFSARWVPDPDYSTQVNYLRQTPCLLEVTPAIGPEQDVKPGETFESYRAFLLPQDSFDRERQGLGLRRMYRTVAPWVTENPLMMHVRYADWKSVKNAIDQCAEVGFEMVILTFGSGFNIEDESPEYIAEMKRYADYARTKGIEIGGYSLLSSRRVEPDSDNCINPKTGKPGGMTHGNCPALAGGWGQDYFRKLYAFFEKTGHMNFEHDGSYPGDLDAASRPPLQKGVEDS
ncbi:MAG TPA: hypothetical protein VM492_16440, partial [Sumerlaeia bacterium]|nr:hypothetical protein [Sumerlaeia bacterium]